MDYLEVGTRHGPIHVVGRIHAEDRPCLLVVTGAFPPAGSKHDLVEKFPGASVLVGLLPGMGGSRIFRAPTPKVYAEAFDELASVLTRDHPLVVCGSSTGCLVSLQMRAPNIVAHVLEEPFFGTDHLWPLVENFQERLRKDPDDDPLRAFMWNFMGYAADRVKNRDYSHLPADISVPTDVLVGELPLEPQRDLPTWPSLTSKGDRAALEANPNVTLHVGPQGSGHGLAHWPEATKMLDKLCHAALLRAAKALA